MSKKLNLGCGIDTKEGWVNLDSAKLPGVDVIHDLENLPLPFESDEFDEILCQDVLEHLDYIPLLKEIHRVMKERGVLTVRVPHFTSKNSYTDPTHKKLFAFRTFHFFTRKGLKGRGYYFDFKFDRLETIHITFEHSSWKYFYNRFIEPLVNMSSGMQYFYESSFLSRFFPAENLVVKLTK